MWQEKYIKQLLKLLLYLQRSFGVSKLNIAILIIMHLMKESKKYYFSGALKFSLKLSFVSN